MNPFLPALGFAPDDRGFPLWRSSATLRDYIQASGVHVTGYRVLRAAQ